MSLTRTGNTSNLESLSSKEYRYDVFELIPAPWAGDASTYEVNADFGVWYFPNLKEAISFCDDLLSLR